MKPNDLLVAFVLAADHPSTVPAFKDLAHATGLSLSQCFDAVQNLHEARLIKPSRKAIDLQAFQTFLLHALPFVTPTQVLGTGQGIALSLSESSAVGGPSGSSASLWVWPDDQGTAQGMQISPFHHQLPKLLQRRPEWTDLLSCIEILRFHEHTLRPKAEERIRHWCENLSQSETPATPRPAPSPRRLDVLSRIIAETGCP